MTSLPTQKPGLGFYYQVALVVVFVLVFFTDLAIYLSHVGIGPPPRLWVVAFSVAAIPLMTRFSARRPYLSAGVLGWSSLYLLVSLISFLLVSQSEVAAQEFGLRLLSIWFLLLSLLIFAGNKTIENWARYTILICTIMAVFNNIIELIDPTFFGSFNETGRPAGFYENPNKTGCALLLGLISSITILPPNYRLLFIGLCGIGIFLTLSRGAILCFLIVAGLFTVQRIISRQQLVYAILGIILITSLTNVSAHLLVSQASDAGLSSNAVTRIETILNPTNRRGDEDTSRLDIVPFSLEKFSASPIVGHGIGHTQEWGTIPPHNMYLFLGVEHGFLGVLIFPCLIFGIIHQAGRAGREMRSMSQSFLIFGLIWGLFSHNLLEERYVLLAFSLIAVMNVRSQLASRSPKSLGFQDAVKANFLGGA
jgi:O-antigen ligase